MSSVVSFRLDDETLGLLDELCAQRGNTRQQLLAHSLDRVLAGHGLLDPALVGERRRARGDEPKVPESESSIVEPPKKLAPPSVEPRV